MKRKIKAFKIISLITFIITVCMLTITIPLHVHENIALGECAATPGCNYIAIVLIMVYMSYFMCFGLLNISVLFCILYNTIKRKAK